MLQKQIVVSRRGLTKSRCHHTPANISNPNLDGRVPLLPCSYILRLPFDKKLCRKRTTQQLAHACRKDGSSAQCVTMGVVHTTRWAVGAAGFCPSKTHSVIKCCHLLYVDSRKCLDALSKGRVIQHVDAAEAHSCRNRDRDHSRTFDQQETQTDRGEKSRASRRCVKLSTAMCAEGTGCGCSILPSLAFALVFTHPFSRQSYILSVWRKRSGR